MSEFIVPVDHQLVPDINYIKLLIGYIKCCITIYDNNNHRFFKDLWPSKKPNSQLVDKYTKMYDPSY